MGRIRSVHPGFFTDADIASLSDSAQLVLIGLLTVADDHGAFEWKPADLKIKLRPASTQAIEPLLQELLTGKRVFRYEYGGKSYGLVRNFTLYQRPKSPKARYFIPEEFRNFTGSADLFPEIPPQMEDGGGNRRMEDGGDKRATRLPKPFELSADWKLEADRIVADEKAGGIAITREFSKFCDYWWGKSGKGATKADWLGTWRNWMRNACDYARERTGGKPVSSAGVLSAEDVT